jgi:uncharacterized protein YbbC (DUF1343 family)
MLAKIKFLFLLGALFPLNCGKSPAAATSETGVAGTAADPQVAAAESVTPPGPATLRVGAARTENYFSRLRGKKLGLVVNHTSRIDSVHLVDSLLRRGFTVTKIFAPEHGFRGTADAGATIRDGRDQATGVPVVSLYGKKKEPSAADLADVDLLLFDIQDVGARFYTYIYTMHYAMQAAAKHGVPFLVLDRPNPNGHYVDGPILDTAGFRSFVGMHPTPVVHGMTVGEYAQMINGEGWLDGGRRAELTVIPCAGYTHATPYELPVRPSPNLPNMRAIYLYPSLCFFEGTTFNVGRGTTTQFQVYGHPDYPAGSYQYTPVSRPGATHPKWENETCYGHSLADLDPEKIRAAGRLDLGYLLRAYRNFPDKAAFFRPGSNFFDLLAGSDRLRQQIVAGLDEAAIRATWTDGLAAFQAVRAQYLLYP